VDAVTREQRINNSRLNAYECAAQASVLQSLPVNVLLQTGTRCNFGCIFCSDRGNGHSNDCRDMSFEQFLAHAEPLARALTVNLYGWCEPLVNPDYQAIYDWVTEKCDGIGLSIVTNGSLLSDQWAKRLVSYKWGWLTVSLNATNASTHQRLTGSNHFDRVIENLQNVIALRRACGKRQPYISLSFVAMVQNIDELPAFVDLAADLGVDAVIIQNLLILRKEHEVYSLIHRQERAREMYRVARRKALERGLGVSLYSPAFYFLDDREQRAPLFCREPWESFWVKPDGDVSMCCYASTVMGNLHRQNMEEIWNGDKYQYCRKYVNSTSPPSDCRQCPLKTYGVRRVETATVEN
jgi:radical SAM protein with 4Fe4S-binding SPASM domain